MIAMGDDDVTNGELHRRLRVLEADVKDMGKTLSAIQVSLIGQAVKVAVFWSALGVGGAGFVISVTGLVLRWSG